MAKKYHQTQKDRKDESRGMKRYEESREKGPMDSQFMGMLKEDHSATANLPQHVVQKDYPKVRFMDDYYLDDTIRGLDDTREDEIETVNRRPSKVKY